MRKTLLNSFIALLLTVSAVSAVTLNVDELKALLGGQQEANMGGMASSVRDIFGAKGTATSTTPVGFYGANVGSTTYPVFIGEDTDSAVISLYTEKASSSAANWQLSILGSNDVKCDTATTSSDVGNQVLVGQVHWFDIGDHLTNKVHSTSLPTGTTTLQYVNPAVETGKMLILENLNYKCIALSVSASSTTGWAQVRTKEYR